MFTYDDLQRLLRAAPFAPFRLHLSSGDHVEIRHRELVIPGRRFALVALPDPGAPDQPIDRYVVVYYLHIAQVEQLDPGAPPLTERPRSDPPPVPSAS